MAPIECPQCHSEIAVCPHCGFTLDDAVAQAEAEKPKSPLGAPTRNLPFGLTFIIAGVLGLIGSLFLLIMSSLLGLLFFAVSAVAMAWGISLTIGRIVTECPFCNQKVYLAPYAQSVTCSHCKTISIRKDNYLELL